MKKNALILFVFSLLIANGINNAIGKSVNENNDVDFGNGISWNHWRKMKDSIHDWPEENWKDVESFAGISITEIIDAINEKSTNIENVRIFKMSAHVTVYDKKYIYEVDPVRFKADSSLNSADGSVRTAFVYCEDISVIGAYADQSKAIEKKTLHLAGCKSQEFNIYHADLYLGDFSMR